MGESKSKRTRLCVRQLVVACASSDYLGVGIPVDLIISIFIHIRVSWNGSKATRKHPIGNVRGGARILERTTMAEYQESTSITFEWNLKGLKNLFESRSVILQRRPLADRYPVPESTLRMYQQSKHQIMYLFINALWTCWLFSRGEMKSRVTRSARFGSGKWQILFYANSGEGNFVSLYLNCEPTQEEKDNAVNGK